MNRKSLFRRLSAWTVTALALVLLAAPMANAAKLKKQNLTALIADAQSIVAGTVTKVNDGIDDKGVPYTEVTIEVGSVAKGDVDKGKYTFRQFGLLNPRTMPNGHQMLGMTPDGFPKWRENEFVVAFMHKPASRTGLQTTSGMAQGKLTMVNDRLANEFDNTGLFDGVQVSPGLLTAEENTLLNSSGPVDATAFMSLVGRAVEGRWIENGEMK